MVNGQYVLGQDRIQSRAVVINLGNGVDSRPCIVFVLKHSFWTVLYLQPCIVFVLKHSFCTLLCLRPLWYLHLGCSCGLVLCKSRPSGQHGLELPSVQLVLDLLFGCEEIMQNLFGAADMLKTAQGTVKFTSKSYCYQVNCTPDCCEPYLSAKTKRRLELY